MSRYLRAADPPSRTLIKGPVQFWYELVLVVVQRFVWSGCGALAVPAPRTDTNTTPRPNTTGTNADAADAPDPASTDTRPDARTADGACGVVPRQRRAHRKTHQGHLRANQGCRPV